MSSDRPDDKSSRAAILIPTNVLSPQAVAAMTESRTSEAFRQLMCGGLAGAVAKTVTAPFSRLTILFQVHSMVTTKEHRPYFAMSLRQGMGKIIERGGLAALWRGNMTSVLHRFPYSAINFYVYENTLDALSGSTNKVRDEERVETQLQLLRRVTRMVIDENDENDNDDDDDEINVDALLRPREETLAIHKLIAGATAGTSACLACYPLDLIRTRLTTELEGREHYRGIVDAFQKIAKSEGILGFYSGVGPTLLVAVPNFAVSYTVYGTLKEYTLDDDLFYNLRRVDADSGEPKLGLLLTILCGAASGTFATLLTFPMDTVRRRMQIQTLHVPLEDRLTARQQFVKLINKEGLRSLYRGLTPEIMKVVPMVGTMFVVYEWSKEMLNVRQGTR